MLDILRNNYLAEEKNSENSGNNFVAEEVKAGAKPGNRNARKHGRYGAKRLAANRALRAYMRDIDALCAEIAQMTKARADRAAIDRCITAKIPRSPREVFMEWMADDEPRTPLPLRHDTSRRGADPGR